MAAVDIGLFGSAKLMRKLRSWVNEVGTSETIFREVFGHSVLV